MLGLQLIAIHLSELNYRVDERWPYLFLGERWLNSPAEVDFTVQAKLADIFVEANRRRGKIIKLSLGRK